MAPAKISDAEALVRSTSTASGPAVGLARIGLIEHLELSGGVLQLHHRAVIDEQVREADGLGQVAAAVAAQIEHQAVDAAAAFSCCSSRRTSCVVLRLLALPPPLSSMSL